jgi:hypothetical protein
MEERPPVWTVAAKYIEQEVVDGRKRGISPGRGLEIC